MSTTQFLTQPDGNRLAYDLDGPAGAPLVLCTPGLGDTRAVYRFLAPRLVAAGYRVATLDLRGEGESSAGWHDYRSAAMASDLLALVRKLGGPAVLVTNSYSAAASVVAATDAPDLVAGLVMTGPFVRNGQTPGGPKGLLIKAAIAVMSRSARAWTAYYRSLYVTTRPADLPAYTRRLTTTLRERGRMAAFRAMLTGNHDESAARLPQVRCPVLIVMGAADPDFPDPAAETRWIADQLAGSGRSTEVLLLPGCGHYPMAEAPQPTADAVTAFLQDVTGRATPSPKVHDA